MTVLVVLVWALVGLRLVLLFHQVARVRGRRPDAPDRPHVDPCLGPLTGLRRDCTRPRTSANPPASGPFGTALRGSPHDIVEVRSERFRAHLPEGGCHGAG